MTKAKKQKRRRAAIKAAAIVYGAGGYDTTEQLWALAVFFDKFIRTGGEGTLEEFGPVEGPAAEVVKLVPKQ